MRGLTQQPCIHLKTLTGTLSHQRSRRERLLLLCRLRRVLRGLFWPSGIAFALTFGLYHDAQPLIPLGMGGLLFALVLALGDVRLRLREERRQHIQEQRLRREQQSSGHTSGLW